MMEKWMEHPLFQTLDPAKQELLQMAAKQTAKKEPKYLAPIMFSLLTGAKKKGITFTPEETELLIQLFNQGKTKEEQDQFAKTYRLVQQMLVNPFPKKQ